MTKLLTAGSLFLLLVSMQGAAESHAVNRADLSSVVIQNVLLDCADCEAHCEAEHSRELARFNTAFLPRKTQEKDRSELQSDAVHPVEIASSTPLRSEYLPDHSVTTRSRCPQHVPLRL